MDNKIVNIKTPALTDSDRLLVAKVIEVNQAEATNIYLPSLNETAKIFAHSSNVPSLAVGDIILVTCVESNYIILHRLRGEDETPQQGFNINADGSLQIDNGEGIVLRVNGAKIEIQQDGRILVEGKEIYSTADGKLHLQGMTIAVD